jgi:hypothetical protein
MQGMIDTVMYQYDVSSNTIRYTIKGSDMGKFFTQYYNLLANKYLTGSKGAASILRNKYKEEWGKMGAFKLDISGMAPLLFKVFSELFQKQLDPISQSLEYVFSDGDTVYDKWGKKGENFLHIADDVMFKYPLWVNFLKDDTSNVNYWSIMKDWVVADFNDLWMDTADEVQKIPLGGKEFVKPLEGFHLYIRPTLNNINTLIASTSRVLHSAKIVSCTLQKTNADVHTLFTVVVSGSYINVGHNFSQGLVAYNMEKVKTYGQKLKVATIKNDFNGEGKQADEQKRAIKGAAKDGIWQKGAEMLKETYSVDDDLLSGTITAIDCNFRVGQKLQMDIPGPKKSQSLGFKAGSQNMVCVVNGISEKIDYMSAKPIPIVTMNVTRGI